MEIVLRLLLACPRCWTALGSVLASVSAAVLFLGWRLAKKSDRLEVATGVVIDWGSVLAALPLPVPTTGPGFALAASCAALGLFLGYLGRWASRF
eukprot:37878-Eustigmatos_ZCMA.PRE.1